MELFIWYESYAIEQISVKYFEHFKKYVKKEVSFSLKIPLFIMNHEPLDFQKQLLKNSYE